MNYRERKEATVKVFEEHEKMCMLFSWLSRSPEVYDDTDEEDEEEELLKEDLVNEGLADIVAGFYETTEEGRQALIQYIQGH